jgi:hypothetical protein
MESEQGSSYNRNHSTENIQVSGTKQSDVQQFGDVRYMSDLSFIGRIGHVVLCLNYFFEAFMYKYRIVIHRFKS